MYFVRYMINVCDITCMLLTTDLVMIYCEWIKCAVQLPIELTVADTGLPIWREKQMVSHPQNGMDWNNLDLHWINWLDK